MLRLQTPLPERYTTASPEHLSRWIRDAKRSLGSRLLILGHHYQRDEVIRWADVTGDSYGLSRVAAERMDAEYIVFCGVHFMAESADVLTKGHQKVLLPDLNAGCSMADMADLDSVETAWSELSRVTDIEQVIPITYMNSAADLKAFVGERGGAVCTSSNAGAVLDWALQRGRQVLFFPDQHLGRNTGYQMGFTAEAMTVWNPRLELGGMSEREAKESTFLLWQGHCSVHQRFRPEHVAAARAQNPDVVIVAHPECSSEVVSLADEVGSTDYIIGVVNNAAPGMSLAIATEIHLVHRLAAQHPELEISSLDPLICPCSTMFRIDEAHLAWVLESLREGQVVNQIQVDRATAGWAGIALQRMLEISEATVPVG